MKVNTQVMDTLVAKAAVASTSHELRCTIMSLHVFGPTECSGLSFGKLNRMHILQKKASANPRKPTAAWLQQCEEQSSPRMNCSIST